MKERIADKHYSPFTVPVIIFADMEPVPNIEAPATQEGVKVLFGTDRLVERLIELAASCNFFYPPTAEHVAKEVKLPMTGLGRQHTRPASRTRNRDHACVSHPDGDPGLPVDYRAGPATGGDEQRRVSQYSMPSA